MTQRTLVWFRQDLRLSDNAAIHHAVSKGLVMPIYILDESQDEFKIGAASRWWLHHSLIKLNKQLHDGLGIYIGKSEHIIADLISEYKLDAVYWNRCYEPSRIKDDTAIKARAKAMGIECESFKSSVIYEPWDITKNDGEYYKVFTPFYKNLLNHDKLLGNLYPKPRNIEIINTKDKAASIDKLRLLPKIHWYSHMEQIWDPGEEGARKQFTDFLNEGLQGYKEGRNFPAQHNVSKLSPHLHFGEISIRQVWSTITGNIKENANSLRTAADKQGASSADMQKFLSELGWREFACHLLYHFPKFSSQNFQNKFDSFAWDDNPEFLKAWQKGQTGYPLVDAGMRELWQTGYMHNRIRMVTASFLVKNLLLDWRKGAEWFWDCLVDADLANNSMNWQWVAGSGVDAAPYFRIFNPVLQGEKFDPDGSYTRHFVPELRELPLKYLFKPFEAPDHILKSAGIRLGYDYPMPIVDLSLSRHKALEAYKTLKEEIKAQV